MSDLDEVLKKLEETTGDIVGGLMIGVETLCKKIQGDAKLLAPSHDGRLRNSIVTGVRIEGNDVVGEVAATANYAVYVELGTGPVGEKSAKLTPPGMNPTYRADGWRYQDEITGEWRYTEGQPAKPFLYPALKQNEAAASDYIAKGIRQAIRKAGRNSG